MTDTIERREKRQRQLNELVSNFERDISPLRTARANAITAQPPSLHLALLKTAVTNIRRSDWYKEFEGARETESALQALKKAFKAEMAKSTGYQPRTSDVLGEQPSAHEPEPDDSDLDAQLLENELWFRLLYAKVVNIDEQDKELPSRRTRIEGRMSFERSIRALMKESQRLVHRDRELLASLPYSDRMFMEGLSDRLVALKEVLTQARANIEPEGQNERESTGPRDSKGKSKGQTDGREVVRYLVEVCMKTYLFCDLAVIKDLIEYSLCSAGHLRDPVLRELIKKTEQRKLENANRWRLDETEMLELASRHTIPIGMVIQHWRGEPSP